ncbi:MAG: FAD-linked oxidase [Porticoccaceae bacterium]|nr:MAG: FAD-linked oxidase [Porticoccaceae bacterium]
MEISGWGRHPRIDARVLRPRTFGQLAATVAGEVSLIPRGGGRSYGDSALAPTVVETRHLDQLLAFDPATGVVRCAAGTTFAQLLDALLPHGWFPPVTPGTAAVTVGGAVAADVHGKNHHRDGSFCDHLLSLEVLTESDGVVRCSPTERPELFRATCGGMGLTGVILAATFRLRAVPGPWIEVESHRAPCLEALLERFAAHAQAPYSVAWIDCLARGRRRGRGILELGRHAPGPAAAPREPWRPAVPADLPGWLLARPAMAAFNALYYHRQRRAVTRALRPCRAFFYPLDGIRHWNRLYGRQGFLQYQFVLPAEAAPAGVAAVLDRCAAAGKGSTLAVLKALGPGNDNLLSFPREGLTLALDFRLERDLPAFLQELDRLVVDHGGRHYLAKDARLSAEVFRTTYPRWEEFAAIRERYGGHRRYHSLQSHRLGL